LLDRYRKLCDTIGKRVRATTLDGTVIEGIARGIGERGELIVDTPRGPRPVEFGEVSHLG